MKKVLLFLSLILIGIQAYAKENIEERPLDMVGKCGFLPPNSVSVTINSNNTLRTTFNQDMPTVAITVKNKNGEVVSRQVVDARELDTVTMQVPPAKEGNYTVEISSSEGVLQGKF